MTRINSAINVRCLTDEHLLAEHREIKRLPFCMHEAIRTGSIKLIPKRFVLGKGHVTFFLDKMLFARRRYRDIYVECRLRHFWVDNYEENFVYGVPEEYQGSYTPTDEEKNLLILRIADRIMNSSKKSWHYYGKAISKEAAVRLLMDDEVNGTI